MMEVGKLEWEYEEAITDSVISGLYRVHSSTVNCPRQLEVVKQEMARVNVEILGISKLK